MFEKWHENSIAQQDRGFALLGNWFLLDVKNVPSLN